MKQSLASIITILVLSQNAYSASDCGVVKVESLLSGPRHGSMMRVTNHSCGADGWICLDPGAETMPAEESRRLYEQASAFHLGNKSFRLSVEDGLYAVACNGNYPIVEDMRTK